MSAIVGGLHRKRFGTPLDILPLDYAALITKLTRLFNSLRLSLKVEVVNEPVDAPADAAPRTETEKHLVFLAIAAAALALILVMASLT